MSEPVKPESPLLDTAAAAAYLDVSEAFIRRMVLERRVRYYKVGSLVRFRAADLDAFVEAGRTDPVPFRVHKKSTLRSKTGRSRA